MAVAGLALLSGLASGCRTRTFADAPSGSDAKGFVPYRTRPGFEGFAIVSKPTPTATPETIFRGLQKGGLPKVEERLRDLLPEQFRGVSWRLEPLGDRMSDFILVPLAEHDLDEGRAAGIAGVIKELGLPHVVDVLPLFTTTGDTATRAIEAAEETRVEGVGSLSTADPEWSLKRTRTLDAHAFLKETKGQAPGQGVVIGQIDTGLSDNPELVGAAGKPNPALRRDLGRNFLLFNDDVTNGMRFWGPLQNPNHGTSTASMIVSPPGKDNAHERRDVWITGGAWGAQLIPTKVSNSVVTAVGWRMAAAMGHLTDRGAKVISMSMGGVPSPITHRAVRKAVEEGVILVSAAGTGVPFVIFPARYPEVVSVASAGVDCRLDPQSAHGDRVDVSAPGTNSWIAWTVANSGSDGFVHTTKQAWGTSLATPQVASAAALWLQHHGWASLAARYGKQNITKVFKRVLATSADKKGPCAKLAGAGYGAGMLDTLALLRAELPPASEIR